MTLSSVDLPEPLCPIRPTDVPEAISRSMLRRAQNSVLFCCVERALTSRSLSDLFALSANLLLTSETRMTVVLDQSSWAKSPCARAK